MPAVPRRDPAAHRRAAALRRRVACRSSASASITREAVTRFWQEMRHRLPAAAGRARGAFDADGRLRQPRRRAAVHGADRPRTARSSPRKLGRLSPARAGTADRTASSPLSQSTDR
ncbi:MAG: hypothetical protein MZV65_37560 [Chromatiales bacterium]|nr:hypothetical protein [Chromatiales bacterium]